MEVRNALLKSSDGVCTAQALPIGVTWPQNTVDLTPREKVLCPEAASNFHSVEHRTQDLHPAKPFL
ncbi:hypothetical protein Pla52o_11690 [Novipirellula galeiformis]|uniref:Uncharacterized protein n=1 Tax=Novipirellula galeiformis TaxID=2528004 RepID=A0A5C6CN13_9BACT|nr:hypothetical protein Pla52o_11690 [Novipirellula galeiformis]